MTFYCSRIFSFTISFLFFIPCYANFFDFSTANLNSTDSFFKFATSVCEMVANKNIDPYQFPEIIKKQRRNSIIKKQSDAYYNFIELESKDDGNDIKFTYALEVKNFNYLIIEYETGAITFTFFDIGKDLDVHNRMSEQARGQLKLNAFKNCTFESIDFEGNGLKSVDELFLKNDSVVKMLDTYLKNKKLADKSFFKINKNYLYVSPSLKKELPTKSSLHKTLVLQFDAGIDYSGPLTKYLPNELSALEKKQNLVTLNDALERRLDQLQNNRYYSVDNLNRLYTLTKVSSYSSTLGFTLGSRYPHALHLTDGSSTHGTVTAGIILRGAESYPIQLFPVSLKALNSNSTNEIEHDAITLLKSLKPRVVNISLGELKKSEAIYYDKIFKDNPNTIFVIAAGNEYLDFEESTIEHYPVMFRYPNTLVVGATTSPLENGDIGEKLPSSNYGRNMVDIMARGEHHISIHPGENMFRMSKERGTSLAAPFVSNILAKMFSIAPNLDAVAAKTILFKHAKKISKFESFVKEGRYIDEDIEDTIVRSLIKKNQSKISN